MSSAPSIHKGLSWRSVLPFVLFGIIAVVAGGLFSALTASTPTRQGAWLVAYLVLVVGVAQIGLGAGQSWLAVHPLRSSLVVTEFAAFTAGNIGVAAGTFSSTPLLVDLGGVLLLASLILFLWGVRGSLRRGWISWIYHLLVLVLLVSIPIGLVLAQIRASS